MPAIAINKALYCYHCGSFLKEEPIQAYDKNFCSDECKSIYAILDMANMLDYYTLTESPGCCHTTSKDRPDFSSLDNETNQKSFILSKTDVETHAVLCLPEIHCSSCWWLIDNLHRLNRNITHSTVDFETKEAHISFNHNEISLRQVAELLANVGYNANLNYVRKGKTIKNHSPVNN